MSETAPLIQLSDQPISLSDCRDLIQSATVGGECHFVGTVRNHRNGKSVSHLLFEAYDSMALREMSHIASLSHQQFDIEKILIHHRLGQVEIGEIAVVIIASAPHRKAAFDACEFAINTLKETVPIWKKEVFEDGEVWVSAHP